MGEAEDFGLGELGPGNVGDGHAAGGGVAEGLAVPDLGVEDGDSVFGQELAGLGGEAGAGLALVDDDPGLEAGAHPGDAGDHLADGQAGPEVRGRRDHRDDDEVGHEERAARYGGLGRGRTIDDDEVVALDLRPEFAAQAVGVSAGSENAGREGLGRRRGSGPAGGGALGVRIGDQDVVAAAGEFAGDAHGERGLAGPALLVGEDDDARGRDAARGGEHLVWTVDTV